jgi:predicted kinase
LSKLLILKGLQASGKSTFAKDLVKKSGNFFRLNRDDFRAMMFDSKWTKNREKVVIAVEKAAAKAILDSGYSVCVDDTNLKNSYHGISDM